LKRKQQETRNVKEVLGYKPSSFGETRYPENAPETVDLKNRMRPEITTIIPRGGFGHRTKGRCNSNV